MPKDSSIFQIPSYSHQKASDFGVSPNSAQIFAELNRISEEIEECRSKRI